MTDVTSEFDIDIDSNNSIVLINSKSPEFSVKTNETETLYTSFPEFDLKTLLQTSPMGNSVLCYYEKNKVLNNIKRKRLVDIVIKHIYTYVINK